MRAQVAFHGLLLAALIAPMACFLKMAAFFCIFTFW
jgi:hypothetical protein